MAQIKQRKRILFDLTKFKEEDYNKKGIYKITNKINKHFYIGSADRSFWIRMREHNSYYLKYKQGGKLVHPLLWAAYDKYDITNFTFEVIEVLDDNCTLQELLSREGYYIRTLKPEYNVCQTPEQGGIPNKGRKLSEEWKQHIAEKSAQYKHDAETLAIVTENNKANACKLVLHKTGEDDLYFNSWVELGKYFNIQSTSAAKTAYKNGRTYHGYTIEKLSSQKKKIKVYFEDGEEIYDSFNKCDKALDMWRGYTSTMYTRGIKVLKDKYKYEVI